MTRERERGCCWLFSASDAAGAVEAADAADVSCPLADDGAPAAGAEAGDDDGVALIGSELKGEDKYLGAAVGDDGCVLRFAGAPPRSPETRS